MPDNIDRFKKKGLQPRLESNQTKKDNISVKKQNFSSLRKLNVRNKTDKEVAEERQSNIDSSVEAQKKSYTKENWRQQLADETKATGDKLRISLKPNVFDDYLNPAAMIGNMASNLGQAPLQAKQSNSILPYITSISTPLLAGALGGIGAKTNSQFANNIVNPLAGINPTSLIGKKSLSKNLTSLQSHIVGIRAGIQDLKAGRPFTETFPLTKKQRLDIEAKQDLAFKEGSDFVKEWNYPDNSNNLRSEVRKKIENLYNPEDKFNNNPDIGNNFKYDWNNPLSQIDSKLVGSRSKQIKNSNISQEAKGYLDKHKDEIGGVNMGETNESITLRNHGFHYKDPKTIKDISIHEDSHTMQDLGATYSPFGNQLAIHDSNNPYFKANYNTKVGKQFQDAMVQPKPDEYLWEGSPNEIHSELMPARNKLYEHYQKEGFTKDQAMTELQNPSEETLNNLIKVGNLNRFFKSTTTDDVKKNLIKIMPAVVPVIGATALNSNTNNNMKQYADGGNLTRFDEGGTHEQNPLGGIPQGVAQDGSQNSVEQGETKSGNFIYSDRITLDSSRVKQFNLPGYAANKSVSAASKAIEDKFKDRNDKYANETKKALLDRLANAQESVKAEQEQTRQAMQTNSQQAPEDMMSGQVPEGMEEFVQPQESQPMAAYGGMQNKYFNGGDIDPVTGLRVPIQALDPMQTAGVSRMPNAMPTAAAVPDSAGIQATSSSGAGTGPSAGALIGGAATALALGQTAFGKAAQDTTGMQASDKISGVGMIGGSAVKGASAGAAFGPLGAGIGAAVGGLAGLAGLGKARKAEALNTQRFATNTNRGLSDNYAAYGGNLNVYKYANGGLIDPPIRTPITQPQLAGNVQSLTGISSAPTNKNMSFNTKQIVRYQPGVSNDKMGNGFYLYSKNVNEPGFDVNRDREFVKQSEMMAVQRTPEWANYMKGQTKFRKGGDLEAVSSLTPKGLNTLTGRATLPTSIPLDIQTPYNGNPYIDKAKLIGKDISNYVSENAGEALRYAPIAANLLQMKNLKKPTGVQYQTLGNRYKPSYVDEAQGRNIVDAEGNNTIAAISQSGASQGATRNAILGAGLNKTKALSDVYANAAAQNRAQDMQAQQFNLNVDQSNVATANKAIDEMRMDDAAYRGAKSKITASLGNSAGAIGKEIADSQLASALTGYTRKGSYLYKPDGSRVTPEEMAKLKNTTQSSSTPPTLKKGDKYTDENGKVQTFKYGGYLNTKRNK